MTLEEEFEIIKEFINEQNIKEKIYKNEDIFERGFKLKKIKIDKQFPEYIYKNKNLFKDWII